jgi:hypothetical protein
MGNVYRQRSLAPDTLLGRVDPDGRVYESRFGPDRYVGHVEAETGKIFRARLGPDEYLGRVDLDSGAIYRQVPLGPDDYVGRVDLEGRLYRQRQLAPDEYVGRIESMGTYAEGGAAFLLLLEGVE